MRLLPLLPLLALAFATTASAQQFYDISHPGLETFEFKLSACKTKWDKDLKEFDASYTATLALALKSGSELVLKAEVWASTSYAATKEAACANARKEFFGDASVRKHIHWLESIRTRTPIMIDSYRGRPVCILPSIRVYRAPGESPIDASEIEWIQTPIACPQ